MVNTHHHFPWNYPSCHVQPYRKPSERDPICYIYGVYGYQPFLNFLNLSSARSWVIAIIWICPCIYVLPYNFLVFSYVLFGYVLVLDCVPIVYSYLLVSTIVKTQCPRSQDGECGMPG